MSYWFESLQRLAWHWTDQSLFPVELLFAGGSGKAAVEQPVHEHQPPGSAVLWESTAYLTSSVSQLSAPLWERQDGDQHGQKIQLSLIIFSGYTQKCDIHELKVRGSTEKSQDQRQSESIRYSSEVRSGEEERHHHIGCFFFLKIYLWAFMPLLGLDRGAVSAKDRDTGIKLGSPRAQ